MTKTAVKASDSNLKELVVRLEQLFVKFNTHGMKGRSSVAWPVIIKRYFYNDIAHYEYEYPLVIKTCPTCA